jgi:hypothetical protein
VNDFHKDAPREIDRDDVLSELLHRFEQEDPSHALAWVLDTLTELDILRYRERADEPSKDLIGTCRREEQDDVFAAFQCITGRDGDGTRWVCTHASDPKRVGRLWGHAYVSRFPVCGAAPGTPAAEAEAREKAVGAAVLREKIRHEEDKQARRDASWPKPAARVFRSEGSEPPEAEYAREADVEAAMRAAESGSAGHWPTVSAVLADEVRRLRGGAS